MGRFACVLVVGLVGCQPRETPREEPRTVASALAAPSSSTPAGNARIPDCRVIGSLHTNEGGDSLENVRVWLDSTGDTIVTSERYSTPEYGDTSRSGHVTWIDWSHPPKERARDVMLPYRAYAAAAYTRVGPTRDGLFAYGVAGAPTFELFSQGYAAWKALNPHQDNALPAARDSTLNFIVTESFHVAPERAVAAVAGYESTCPGSYDCGEPLPTTALPPERSVRIVSLEKPPRSYVVWRAREKLGKDLVPDIAFGPDLGAVAFRAKGEILLARLDANLSPEKPQKLGGGDVGAPALAFQNREPVVAWAERATSGDPFRIVIFDGTRHELRAGNESAFAPSIALFEDQLLVAFMTGSSGTGGKIRLARVTLAALRDVVDISKAADLSAGAPNARDPELVVSGTNVVLAWSDFSKKGPNRIEVRRLDCKNP